MDYVALISQIAGSAAGQAASQMDKDQVMALIKSVSDDYGKIDVPKLQTLIGQQQGKTNLAAIKDDPTYRGQQNAADAQLNDVINSGGQTLSDAAALNAIRNKISRTASAGRNAITNGMAARGTLDSGATLAAELSNNQNAAQLANDAGEQAAGAADARHYQAIKDRAALAGQGLDRSYAQQANAARAQDEINRGNIAIANTTAMHNAALPQQDFQNQMSLAGAKAAPAYALAGAHAAQAQNTQDQFNKLGAIGAAGANKAGSSSNNTGNAGGSSPDEWNQYTSPPPSTQASSSEPGTPSWDSGSSSDALSSASTKPARQKEIVGYDDNGAPIWGYRSQS